MSSASSDSDIDLPPVIPQKINKKAPKNPAEDHLIKKQKIKQIPTGQNESNDPKKITTKLMIHQALNESKSRKGVSLYAIKKYLTEKYNVDTEKNKYLIKKSLKKAVEEGTIVQLKGIGASGSFKLPVKEKKKVKPKKNKDEVEGQRDTENSIKTNKPKEKLKIIVEKAVKTKTKPKETKSSDKTAKLTKNMSKDKLPEQKKGGEVREKPKKIKIAKGMQTPSKKKTAMMKRKSIGSILKTPKMKPKAKA